MNDPYSSQLKQLKKYMDFTSAFEILFVLYDVKESCYLVFENINDSNKPDNILKEFGLEFCSCFFYSFNYFISKKKEIVNELKLEIIDNFNIRNDEKIG